MIDWMNPSDDVVEARRIGYEEGYAQAESDFEESKLDLRKPLAWFAQRMEEKLKENDQKGGWSTCGRLWLLKRLKDEVDELREAFLGATMTDPGEFRFADEDVVRECADVANMAMMIATVTADKCDGENGE